MAKRKPSARRGGGGRAGGTVTLQNLAKLLRTKGGGSKKKKQTPKPPRPLMPRETPMRRLVATYTTRTTSPGVPAGVVSDSGAVAATTTGGAVRYIIVSPRIFGGYAAAAALQFSRVCRSTPIRFTFLHNIPSSQPGHMVMAIDNSVDRNWVRPADPSGPLAPAAYESLYQQYITFRKPDAVLGDATMDHSIVDVDGKEWVRNDETIGGVPKPPDCLSNAGVVHMLIVVLAGTPTAGIGTDNFGNIEASTSFIYDGGHEPNVAA